MRSHEQRIPPYSITLSACATNPAGISRPSSFAALRLMTNSPMGFLKERHLRWLAAIENFDDLRSDAPSSRLLVEGVGHQRSGLDRATVRANSGHTIFLDQSAQQTTVSVVLRFVGYHDSIDMISLHGVESVPVLGFVNRSLQRDVHLLGGLSHGLGIRNLPSCRTLRTLCSVIAV
jgi:hypothetical protein